MPDINWTLLIFAGVIFEVISGGWLTSNLAGGAYAAGGAAWRSASESARAAYGARRDRLNESAIGRWRLKAEARLGRFAQALGLASWRFGLASAKVALDGAVAGYRAAPAGAAKGRAVRRWVISSAKDAAKTALARPVPSRRVSRLRRNRTRRATGPRLNPPRRMPPPPVEEDWSGDPWIEGPEASAPICGACRKPIKDGLCACGMFARRPKDDTTSAPDSPERGTEEPVSSNTNLDAAAEKVGVVKYLAAWDGEVGGLELVASTLDALKDRITKAGEKNGRHDPDGVTDIAGRVDAAIQAVLAADEAISGHAKALHEKWDETVERAKSTGAESADELLGAH